MSAVSSDQMMPAEWDRHEATWLVWPHNTSDWPGRFGPIPWVYAEIVRNIVCGERVELLVNNATHEEKARRVLTRVGVPLDQIRFRRFPTNRGWTRDFGPIFVRSEKSGVSVARFRFNAWAKYSDWRMDDRVPVRAATAIKKRVVPVRTQVMQAGRDGSSQAVQRDVVLEGGSIDVNGAGTILTTEECLLDPTVQVRNPGLERAGYERVFGEALGARNTIWLGRGIAGDDTHGHVDDLARFVNAKTIVLCHEKSGNDENHRALEENRERLESARLEGGQRPAVIPLPMPAAVVFDGRRLPASYANFYIANAGVLVPTFNDPNDRIALGILGELFPDRPVVGIHAVDLVWGLGTIHCLSQQQPAAA